MCGICGVIQKNGAKNGASAAVKSMNAALLHRGPDSEGYFESGAVSIGMRRLSIIDLGTGQQPLYNEDRSMVLIANGEIYNFVELRRALESCGHRFATGSDCEAIIHAYEEFGAPLFLEHLRGMFGFCLYDKAKGKVFIVRDRMGEKPVYIYESDDSIIFSSEIKSILQAVPPDKRTIDKESVYSYFHYGYIPRERTMFYEVKRLAPGTMLAIDEKTGKKESFAYWRKDSIRTGKMADPAKEIQESLKEIERMIIRSDVPVGVSLSGGLDSSVIAMLASRYSKEKLHAFSVGYRGSPENDERKAAKKLAGELGMTFHDIELTEEQFAHALPRIAASMDEPISDIAAFGYYSVSEAARKAGVPVLLAGFGSDELYWGYDWVRRAARWSDLKATAFGRLSLFFMLARRNWRELAKNPAAMLSSISRSAFSDRAIFYELTPNWSYMRKNERAIFEPGFLSAVDREAPFRAQSAPLSRNNGRKITELLCDLWLLSNCIDLGDRMSMAHSIELRLPFVDYRLYEQAISIREKHPKDYEAGYKHWFIEAVRGFVPKEIIERKKRGFTPPTGLWIEHALKAHSELLKEGYLVKNGIIKKSFVERSLRAPAKNQRFLYSMLVLELWAARYL